MANGDVNGVVASLHATADDRRFDVETGRPAALSNELRPPSLTLGPVREAERRGSAPRLAGCADLNKLDEVASQLREICRTAALDLSYRVGELIIREVYDNKFEIWGEQGTRRTSYRLLAARGDLPLSPSALCKSVAVYVLSERLGGRAHWKHLGSSHLQEVLALPAEEQDRVLQTAEAEHWTVARIRAEVSSVKPKRNRRKGQAHFRAAVGALRDCISKHRDSLVAMDGLEGIDSGVAGQFCDIVAFLKLQVHELEQTLSRFKVKQRAAMSARESFIRPAASELQNEASPSVAVLAAAAER